MTVKTSKIKKPTSAKQALEMAYALIKNKKNWCKNELAINKSGEDVLVTSPDAVAFCAVGALDKIDGRFQRTATKRLEDACVQLFGDNCISVVNDDRGHAAILKAFCLAIKKEK